MWQQHHEIIIPFYILHIPVIWVLLFAALMTEFTAKELQYPSEFM